jgi:eukaryotic-like serine/threonine-protein kinase
MGRERNMTSEKWRTAWEIYSDARDLSQEERESFLVAVQPEPDVLQEVLFLLDEPEEPAPEAGPEHKAWLASFAMGRYKMLDYLGKGGVSEVYSAQDQQLGRIVALKFLLPGTIGVRSTDRVMCEAKTLSSLNHPNIVTVYEVIESASGLAIVMELVEGRALRSLCGTSLAEDQVIRIGQQIAQALAAAHAHGIVHRDIKPENILVRPDGYVKVVDFGLARQMAADGSTSTFGVTAGTLQYMSPEQVQGSSVSPASDIFSVGLVLYELAAGHHPFTAESSIQTAYSIATKQPAGLPEGNGTRTSRLHRLILTMLARDAADRPSAAEVARELGEIRLMPAVVPLMEASPGRPLKRIIWLSALALAVMGAAWFVFSTPDFTRYSDLKIEPLTSQAGWEFGPALSPDGQSVAFTWADRLDGTRNIYVRKLSQDQPVKLTDISEGLVGYLAWSPDGKRIAFKHSGTAKAPFSGSISSVSISDGKEQRLLNLKNSDISSSIDWSPDGNDLAFSEAWPAGTQRLALYLLNLRTGKTQRLTSPPENDWGDWNPRFSPDGSTLAFKRVSGFWVDDLYLVSRGGGLPRRLTTTGRGIWGHAWMPDGRSLLVSCQRTGSIFGIWRFPLRRNEQPERISAGAIDAIAPTTGRHTNRIAWVNQLWDLNIYRIATSGAGAPVRMIASTLRDQGAAYSPDGRIAFVSDRSGSREIWLAHRDGSGQVRVTNLKGPPIDHLQWSPDGAQLAFDSRLFSRIGIFTIQCRPPGMSCEAPKPVTSDGRPESAPSWSLDGKFLYFSSQRTGQSEIWKRPWPGAGLVQVTHGGGYTSSESPDGKWLYFSKSEVESIFRQPVSKLGSQSISEPQLVVGPPYRVQPGGWALARNEIVFIDRAARDHPPVIRAFNPATKAVRSILSLRELFADRSDIGLSISPDEKWILYSELDRSGSNIMLAENR